MRTSVLFVWVDGWRRVWRAPGVTLGAFVALIAFVMGQVGSPRAVILDPLLGVDGAFATLSAFVGPGILVLPMPAATVPTVALWFFLLGGLIDRLARDRRVEAAPFFATCGVFFFRFLRLAAMMAVAYWLVGGPLRVWLFGAVGPALARRMANPDQVRWLGVAISLLFIAVLSAVNLIGDYARVRAVVEDRRSMLGAVMAALRFMRRRPLRVALLYVSNVFVWLLVVRLFLSLAPTVPANAWTAFLGGMLYAFTRLVAILGCVASEIAFFQGELAHAAYTALPDPVWPDSPAAEAIANLTRN